MLMWRPVVVEILRSVIKLTVQQCKNAALQVNRPFKIQCKGVNDNMLVKVVSHPCHGK